MTKLPLSARAWGRIQPFLHHKRARQRVVLYLIAGGYTVPELVKMTVADLRVLRMHDELIVARDEATDGLSPKDHAFANAHKKVLPHTAFYRIIRLAALSATGRTMSQEIYREYVNK
jgi:hypothetical protein